jgi:hypothetical protein
MIHTLVIPVRGEGELAFYSGKYTNHFWQLPDVEHKNSCQKISKLCELKTNVYIENYFLDPVFKIQDSHVPNLRVLIQSSQKKKKLQTSDNTYLQLNVLKRFKNMYKKVAANCNITILCTP